MNLNAMPTIPCSANLSQRYPRVVGSRQVTCCSRTQWSSRNSIEHSSSDGDDHAAALATSSDAAGNWFPPPKVDASSGAAVCPNCNMSGKTLCMTCEGMGRTNWCDKHVLPKGAWPRWCLECRGAGTLLCVRCDGSGEFRPELGIRPPTVNR